MIARSAIKSNMRAKCITTSTAVKLAFFYSHLYCTSKKKEAETSQIILVNCQLLKSILDIFRAHNQLRVLGSHL